MQLSLRMERQTRTTHAAHFSLSITLKTRSPFNNNEIIIIIINKKNNNEIIFLPNRIGCEFLTYLALCVVYPGCK